MCRYMDLTSFMAMWWVGQWTLDLQPCNNLWPYLTIFICSLMIFILLLSNLLLGVSDCPMSHETRSPPQTVVWPRSRGM